MKDKIISSLSNDPHLLPILDLIPFPVLQKSKVPLAEVLIESIVYQQLSIKAAATIYGRLIDKFESKKIDLKKLSRMRVDTLRKVGLSYAKADYVKNIAKFFLHPPHQNLAWDMMDDDELMKKLIQIKGVGQWTVQMIQIAKLGRTDIFPALDLNIQQAMIKLYGLTEKGKDLSARMHTIAEHWKPYRTYVCMYFWRWKDLSKNKVLS